MSSDPLWAEYNHYDRRVDIVSIAQVWFTRAEKMSTTVRHFERFPRITHPDGNDATPDFTVLFEDDTAVIGELANLALAPGSLDSLASQLQRYSELTEVQSAPMSGSQRPMQQVREVDVLLFSPADVANAACDRLAAAIDNNSHPYSPLRPPMVLSYSFDPDQGAYTFQRPTRAKNDLLPDYGRDPSLTTWLQGASDTLRGLPAQFGHVKASARFMNDDPPALYTATVIWSVLLPSYVADQKLDAPVDLPFSVEELVDRMRRDFGFGRARDVREALEFLKIARLAAETAEGWEIYFRDLGSIAGEISQALLHEYRSLTNKTRPIRTARKSEEGEIEEEAQAGLFDEDQVAS